MTNRSVPTGALLPHLIYRDLSQASDWLTRVFGWTERYRYGDPLSGIQLSLGDASIMLIAPKPELGSPAVLGQGTQMLTVIVPDVEAHYRQAQEAGAIIWELLNETIYGELQYGATDLEGHRWIYSQHARDVDPAEWGATRSTLLAR